MLLRFAAANHRSILEPVELSMIALDADRPSVKRFELLNEGVLSVAGIYGANASGKSNVLDALVWLGRAVQQSLRGWDQYVPRDPFRFAEDPSAPSTYQIEMMVQGVRYAYTVEVDDERVISEALRSYPERKPRTILERDHMNVELRRGIGGTAAIKELMTDTALALSVAMRLSIDEIEPFARAVAGITSLGVRSGLRARFGRSPWRDPDSTERMFADARQGDLQPSLFEASETALEESHRTTHDAALALLKHADLGIDGVEVTDGGPKQEIRGIRGIKLLHRIGGRSVALDMFDESEGTRTWFRLIGPVLGAIQHGRVVLVDEIDASLHPRLSAILLDLFRSPESNPKNAQLIFTTHDTSLLNHLNRDEVWLTEKASDGATRLIALADYGGEKVRRSLNLEKAYLQGRFGGVPEADQVLLRQALGLLAGGD